MFRFFLSDLRRNIIKVVCLTLGLAIGFLLVAKVYFEETFDSALPDHERMYILKESVEMNGEYREYSYTPGAIAPALKRYSPYVEAATRYCHLYYGDTRVQTEGGAAVYADRVIFADSCFFDVLQTEITAGNPKEALSVKNSVMIPASLAEKLGGDVLGKDLIFLDGDPDARVKIEGIYRDFPLNSSFPNAVCISLASLGQYRWDGSENWMGNDNYTSVVRLAKGASPEDIQPHVRQMLQDNIDREALEMTNFNISATPLDGFYLADDNVRTMIWILSLLALVILMCGGLNYLLVTLGQMGKRSKEMAVRKCYGTSNLKIFARVMCESVFYLVVSMGLAVLLVFCFSDTSRYLLGYTPAQLFSTDKVWIVEALVCLALLVPTGLVPARIYCATPVAHSFSAKVKSRRIWKLTLLSVQFFASSLLLCMLALVGRQFMYVSSVDMGVDYENLGTLNLSYVPQSTRSALVGELKKLSCVEGVSSADSDFLNWFGGNNVWDEDEEKQVNVSDHYYANADIIDVMGMRLLEGSTFDENSDSTVHQVIVEEKFHDVLRKIGKEIKEEGIVGETFRISEHYYETNGVKDYQYLICGVVDNMKRGGFEKGSSDPRAAVFFPAKNIRDNVFIRFHQMSPENMREVQNVVNRVVSEKEIFVSPYRERVMELVKPVKNFAMAVLVIGLTILVIALIGLVGYTADEVVLRSKEVAVRKVSGYTARQIMKLFIRDILRIALPATIAGGLVAIPIGRKWISQFSDQTSLSPGFNLLCIVLLIVIIICVVASNTLSIARDNPVKHLKRE